MLLAALAAAILALGCDLENPSGAPGCTRGAVDALKLNDLQAVGTHNSYKQAIAPPVLAMIRAASPAQADALDYSHPPLAEQLEAGARQLELDILVDPEGNRYAKPLGAAIADADDDLADLTRPGLKVLHAQDIDYRSHCHLFVKCLAEVRAWSKAHPDHLPLLILVNLKIGAIGGVPGGSVAPEFDVAAFRGVDAEIRSVFGPGEMIAPDEVRGRHKTLREGVLAGGWPTLGAARGKVLFALDAGPGPVAVYVAGGALAGRAMFVNADEASPAAAYLTLNEPIELAGRIRAAVKAGFLVRTRADADTAEARRNDPRRREAAFASGAQYVSTDYMRADPRLSDYAVSLPGGGVGRLNPLQVGAAGRDSSK